MANHDPISDMLTRIRNASEKRHESTKVPASRMSRSIAKVLQQEGFIAEISEQGEGVRTELVLGLKYSGKHRQPTIRSMQRVSKAWPPHLQKHARPAQGPRRTRGSHHLHLQGCDERPRRPQARRGRRSALLRLLTRNLNHVTYW
jgi:ribosomal protein S8